MLYNSLITALFITALRKLVEPGMLLEKVYNWFLIRSLNKKFKQRWYFKIIIGCTYCMSSFWGIIAFFYFFGKTYNFIGLIVFLMSILGLLCLFDIIKKYEI